MRLIFPKTGIITVCIPVKEMKMKKKNDFKSAFYLSLVIFSVLAFIVGIIVVEVVRF